MENNSSKNKRAEEEAAELVRDRWNNFRSNSNMWRRRLSDFYKQYRGIPGRKSYDGNANVFVNETLESIEAIVAQAYNTIYSEPKELRVEGREQTDENKAKLIETMTIASLDHMNARPKILDHIRQCVKYGTTVAEVVWRFEEREIIQRTDIGGGVKRPESVTKAVFDNPEIMYVDLLDFACDPGKSRIDQMDWVIIRKRTTKDALKAKEMRVREINGKKALRGVYGNIDKVIELPEYEQEDKSLGQKKNLQDIGINYDQIDESEHEVLKMWGNVKRWWVEDVREDSDAGQEMVPGVIEVVDQKVTIRLHRNPYWHQEIPVIMAQFIRDDANAFGIGVCEILEYLQQELNDKRNQLLDHASLTIMPPLVKLRSANIPNEKVKLKPRHIITSDVPGKEAIQPLTVGGDPREIVTMEGIIKQDMRNQSGANNPLQGIKAGGDTTAFEVSVLEKRAASRVNVHTMDFANNFLKPFYRFVYKLLQQYVSKERAVRTVGKDGIRWDKISPEDLMADLDLIPKVPTDADSRTIVRNQLIQFLTAIAKFYPQVNAYRLIQKIYSLFGHDDVDEVVPAPQNEMGQGGVSTEEEMMVLSLGQKINAKYFEDHVTKIDAAVNFMRSNSVVEQDARDAFQDYIRQHEAYLKSAEQAAKVMSAKQETGGSAQESPQNIPGGNGVLNNVGAKQVASRGG